MYARKWRPRAPENDGISRAAYMSVRGFVGEHEVLNSRSSCRAEAVEEGGRGEEDH